MTRSKSMESTLCIALIAVSERTAPVRAVRVRITNLHASIHRSLALGKNSSSFLSHLYFPVGDISNVT